MYSNGALALQQQPPVPSGLSTLRRHSRSRSNSSLSSASTSFLVSDPKRAKATGKRPPPIQTAPSAALPPRPSTAPYRPDWEERIDEAAEDYVKRSQTSPASKRRSSIAEGIVDRWTQSPTNSGKTAGDEREQKRRSSFARSFSLGGNASVGSLNGSSKLPSPTRSPTSRRPATDARRRKSPDTSPSKRRSLHSPPPPAGVTRSTATLPPISTLPSLPKLTFEPLSSSTGTPSPPTVLGSPLNDPAAQFDYFDSKYSSRAQRSPKKTKRDVSGRIRPGPNNSTDDLQPSRKDNAEPFPPADPYIATSIYAPNVQATRQRAGSRSSNRERSASESSILGPNLSGGSGGTPTRKRDKRERDKKAMLSRALQKANTAVLLDNAQNFEGAVDAYRDACELLHEVMLKSSGEEDKRKLDAIVSVYTYLLCGVPNLRHLKLSRFGLGCVSLSLTLELIRGVTATNIYKSNHRALRGQSGIGQSTAWETTTCSTRERSRTTCASFK